MMNSACLAELVNRYDVIKIVKRVASQHADQGRRIKMLRSTHVDVK